MRMDNYCYQKVKDEKINRPISNIYLNVLIEKVIISIFNIQFHCSKILDHVIS